MTDIERAALILLRAMNDLIAKGEPDVPVAATTIVLEHANLLREDYPYVDPAIKWLIKENALVPADEADTMTGGLVGLPDHGMHYITQHGLNLLEQYT
jgi:hypothetical protein